MSATVIWFRDLDKWNIPKILRLTSALPSGWSSVPIGNLVTQVTERVKVEKDKEYQLIGVKWYCEGTFHRETVKGNEISAPYLAPVIPNAFIYNRLFAWKQSFAIVPQQHSGFYVSNEFPQFIVDTSKILPEYLYLIFRLQKTVHAVLSASVGSAAVSRNRFKEEEFLKFEIPVPPLNIQRAIVTRWQQKQKDAAQAEAQVTQIEDNLQTQVFSDLGLRVPARTQKPKAFLTGWHAFDRWSVSFNQACLNSVDIEHGKYPVLELGNILSTVQYGTSEKANGRQIGVPVLRINNIKNGMIDISDLKHVPLDGKTKYGLLLQDGDILIIRTSGSRDLVGSCATFHEPREYVFASYLIRLRVEKDKAHPDYISWFINSPLGRQQIDALSRQIMQNNINSVELRSLQIPLPPLDVQRAIVEKVQASRAETARQRAQTAQIRKEAESELEALILGTKKIE